MDSVCRVLLFVFCVGLVPALSQSSPASPPMLGMWSAGSVDGIAPVQRQECAALTFSERRIRLSAVPGTNKFEGEWIRTIANIWMNTDNRNCRWFPEASLFESMFQATWAYLLDAVYDPARGVMKVDGRFSKCDGNGCDRLVTANAKNPFHTELRMNNSRLVDTNMTDDPSDDLEFIRVSDEADRADDAKTALSSWLKALDGGDFGRFYDQATSSNLRTNTSRKDFVDRLSTQRDRVGATTSRQTLKTLYAEHAPFISKSAGEYVLFCNGVESSKSARGMEFLLLVNDGGTWKVTWLNYGS